MLDKPTRKHKRYNSYDIKPSPIVWAVEEISRAKNISDVLDLIDFANAHNPYWLAHLGICSLDGVMIKDVIYERPIPGIEFSPDDLPEEVKWGICREAELLLRPFDLLSHEFGTIAMAKLDEIRELGADLGLKQIMIIPMKIKNTTTVVAVHFPEGNFEYYASRVLPQIYQFTYAVFEKFPSLLLWPKSGKLTRREVEILTLSAKGLTEAAIAAHCGISINTVRNHVENSKVKLNARNKLHAVMIAAETHEIESILE